jgi:hypothetical protein
MSESCVTSRPHALGQQHCWGLFGTQKGSLWAWYPLFFVTYRIAPTCFSLHSLFTHISGFTTFGSRVLILDLYLHTCLAIRSVGARVLLLNLYLHTCLATQSVGAHVCFTYLYLHTCLASQSVGTHVLLLDLCSHKSGYWIYGRILTKGRNIYACLQTKPHTHTRTYAHTHIRTHARTHTYTHKHTHLKLCVEVSEAWAGSNAWSKGCHACTRWSHTQNNQMVRSRMYTRGSYDAYD